MFYGGAKLGVNAKKVGGRCVKSGTLGVTIV